LFFYYLCIHSATKVQFFFHFSPFTFLFSFFFVTLSLCGEGTFAPLNRTLPLCGEGIFAPLNRTLPLCGEGIFAPLNRTLPLRGEGIFAPLNRTLPLCGEGTHARKSSNKFGFSLA